MFFKVIEKGFKRLSGLSIRELVNVALFLAKGPKSKYVPSEIK